MVVGFGVPRGNIVAFVLGLTIIFRLARRNAMTIIFGRGAVVVSPSYGSSIPLRAEPSSNRFYCLTLAKVSD